jgi:hypothetical protein
VLAFWRFLTLLLSALGLTLGAAHALELPPKMGYDAQLYAAVTSTLYQLFGSVGAVVQVGSVVAAAILTIMVRRLPAFRLTLLGTLCLALSLAGVRGMLAGLVNGITALRAGAVTLIRSQARSLGSR